MPYGIEKPAWTFYRIRKIKICIYSIYLYTFYMNENIYLSLSIYDRRNILHILEMVTLQEVFDVSAFRLTDLNSIIPLCLRCL